MRPTAGSKARRKGSSRASGLRSLAAHGFSVDPGHNPIGPWLSPPPRQSVWSGAQPIRAEKPSRCRGPADSRQSQESTLRSRSLLSPPSHLVGAGDLLTVQRPPTAPDVPRRLAPAKEHCSSSTAAWRRGAARQKRPLSGPHSGGGHGPRARETTRSTPQHVPPIDRCIRPDNNYYQAIFRLIETT